MKPLLLDLFCGAGGCAVGYAQAGFEVIGVDLNEQPRFPFDFIQEDALAFLQQENLSRFDFIHASPPCQRYSVATKTSGNPSSHPDLIDPIWYELVRSGKPWAIENVVGSPLVNPILLCGTMFPPLRVIRHRLFETNWELPKHPLCVTTKKSRPHFGQLDEMKDFVQVTGGGNCSKAAAADAMGIDWMLKKELNQATPPAYTEYIGKEFLHG